MTKEQFRAFEDHCRASETYKYLKIDRQAQAEKWLDEMRPTGEMALEDFERFEEFHLERFLDDRDRYKTIKVKGYNNGKSSKNDCYACATQRYNCDEHTDWEEYQNGKSWEDEAPRKEEFEDGI